MRETLDENTSNLVARLILDSLSSKEYLEHALEYKQRYSDKAETNRQDHGLAKGILRMALKTPKRAKIGVSGYEKMPNGMVRYIAYVWAPSLSREGVAKIVTADSQLPPREGMALPILTCYRQPLTSSLGKWMSHRMTIAALTGGVSQEEYSGMQGLTAKLSALTSRKSKLANSIPDLFLEALSGHQEVKFNDLKTKMLAIGQMNRKITDTIREIKRSRPDYGVPEPEFELVPDDEYYGMLREFAEVGLKKFDRLYTEYMPDKVSEVNLRYKWLSKRLMCSLPSSESAIAEGTGLALNPLMEQYCAFIESICAQYGCPDMVAPIQEGLSALCEAEDDDDDGMRQCKVCHEWKFPEDLDENGVCKAYQEDDDVYDYCQRLYNSVGGNVKLIRRAKCQSCGMPIIGDQTMPKSYLTSYVCDRCQSKRNAAPARTRCCNCGVQLNDPSLYTKDGLCPACDEIFGEFGKAAFGNREPKKSECEQCHRNFYLCELDDNGLCRDCAGDDWDDRYTGRDPDMTPKDHCSVCHRPLYSLGSVDTYGRCRKCEKKLKPGSK